MCLCDPFCLIPLGCDIKPHTIDKPTDYPPSPSKMMCPSCGAVGKPEYRQKKQYCGLICCTCIPCSKIGEPYMACSSCDFPLTNACIDECPRCSVAMGYNSNYCPCCGTNRSSMAGSTNMFGRPTRNNDSDSDHGDRTSGGDRSKGRKIGELRGK